MFPYYSSITGIQTDGRMYIGQDIPILILRILKHKSVIIGVPFGVKKITVTCGEVSGKIPDNAF